MDERLATLHAEVSALRPPNRERVLLLIRDHAPRLLRARGSSHNHQAWAGGYLDHVNDVMQIASVLYAAMSEFRKLPFNLQDARLVLFLHDLEKPWKEDHVFVDKLDRARFRWVKIHEYGIELTEEQENAIRYVEGEGDEYSPKRRVMNEMAAFCHMCDVASARVWHSA